MDRDELHSLVMLLKEELEKGNIKFAEGLDVTASLQRIRFAPDGKVDPATVDGVVRTLAYLAAESRRRTEMRQVPLIETQTEYFNLVNSAFGKLFDEMNRHGVTPYEIAEHFSSREEAVKAFTTDFSEFAAGVREFWEYYAPIVQVHLEELRALKSVFGGDVFPSYTVNIACSVGLYMDTIVLPDPLLRLLDLDAALKPRELLALIVKHALNVLRYRELALAAVDPPIVVIAPDLTSMDQSYRTALKMSGESDALEHAARVFGRQFSTTEELVAFLKENSSSDQLVARVTDPKRLLLDLDWPLNPEAQIGRYKQQLESQLKEGVFSSAGDMTYGAFFGRMMQINDVIFRSNRYNGSPLIDAPTSWQYLLWKYQYDAEGSMPAGAVARDLIVSKAIEVEGSREFGFLTGVPPDTLIKLRQDGALAKVREVIRTGIQEIDLASPNAVSETSDHVIANIDAAFTEHERNLRDLASSKRKFYGFDVGRWIGFGGLTVAAAVTGNAGWGVLAAVAQMVGAPQISDLRKKWKELHSRTDTLQRSPTGILFRDLKQKFGFS